MPLFNNNPDGIVVDRDGRSLGLVTPQLVVSALAAAPDQR